MSDIRQRSRENDPDAIDEPDLAPYERRPAGFAVGPGHVVVYGNAAFRSTFGAAAVGLPARETMLDLPAEAFALLDAVFTAAGRSRGGCSGPTGPGG